MSQRDIDTDMLKTDMLTPAFRFLIEVATTYGTEPLPIKELRRQYGSKIYNYMYKLAIYGLVGYDRTNFYVTEKGKRLSFCIGKCIFSIVE
ncbi:MAG: hypothetical protein GSR81_02835 [Desulfurococcales archaeon]|nr:hypothetical protein [Desulfurococcales archaeon]